jgi:hypothetical protein
MTMQLQGLTSGGAGIYRGRIRPGVKRRKDKKCAEDPNYARNRLHRNPVQLSAIVAPLRPRFTNTAPRSVINSTPRVFYATARRM